MKSASLKNKNAIVTGASRGIGLAIAKSLAREGVRLGFLSRSKPGIGGEFVACDLADSDKIPGAVRQLVERLGSVDFLINNAGIFLEKSVPETQLADWERVLRVNVTAPFLITREILPQMIARKQGRIINIASTSSSQGYCTSPPIAPANMRCLASPARWHWRRSLTVSTFIIFVPVAWIPTSSRTLTLANV